MFTPAAVAVSSARAYVPRLLPSHGEVLLYSWLNKNDIHLPTFHCSAASSESDILRLSGDGPLR